MVVFLDGFYGTYFQNDFLLFRIKVKLLYIVVLLSTSTFMSKTKKN